MLLVQLREMKNFTNHERDVAEYILGHMDQIPDISAGELGRASLTSKATVVRLSKKLGLSGYQELKLRLVAEMNQSERISQLISKEPITGNSSYSDIILTLPGLYDKAITNTRLTLDKNTMMRIGRFLQGAECIDIYGTGISYVLAQAAAFKFATLGLECSAYESINGHYLAARKHKRTVAFLISFTGANRTVERMGEYLMTATNNHIVGILGPHSQVTGKWCHEVVEIPNRDSVLSLDVITSFMAGNYVFDIFFSMLLAGCQEEHVKSSLEMQKHESLLLNSAGEEP
ncbi:transcriptional regulators [Clostridium sp. CAG:149]|nr:transcriptional regulators [Clostridium sp. CAG:149]